MSGDQLTNGQGDPLAQRILGHVRRLVDDVKALKVDPHRMCGVCQAPVRKCIGRKQVAELVVELGFRDADQQPDGGAPSESDESYQRHRQCFRNLDPA